jgi:glycosyltransferase involved in cell wall biosynthesis
MNRAKVAAAIIPAFNEEERIFETVQAAFFIPEIKSVLVVDDGSADDTAGAARRAGAAVLRLSRRKGKGGALNCGLKRAEGEVILLLDADLGKTAREARSLLLPILEGQADMTIARFPETRRRSGFGLVKGLARKGIKYFTGLDLGSPLSGQRALRRDVLGKVTPLAPGFGVEVELTVKAVRAGLRILEVPVEMDNRDYGRSLQGFCHRGKQFLAVAAALTRMFFKKFWVKSIAGRF